MDADSKFENLHISSAKLKCKAGERNGLFKCKSLVTKLWRYVWQAIKIPT